MKAFWRLSILLKIFFVFFLIFPLQASLVTTIGSCLARNLKSLVIDKNVTNLSNSEVLVFSSQNRDQVWSLSLGNRLGTGWYGSAYRLENFPTSWGLAQDQRYVVKFPHSLSPSSEVNTSVSPLWITNRSLLREAELYDYLMESIPLLEKSERLTSMRYWAQGTLPVVPISARFNTDAGMLLVKPEVVGLTLEKIAARYGTNLPDEMLESLRAIYQLTQDLYSTVPLSPELLQRGTLEGRPGSFLSIDIRPPNLVWIEEPSQLQRFNLSRPGFILFEMDQVPQNLPAYVGPNHRFENYLEELQSYLLQGGG